MAFGRIPQSFIDDVLLKTDIVDLIDGRVKLKKAGKNYAACCPFHQEKSPSFTVSPDKQFYYCFGCGASGNAVSFLMDFERLGFIDSLKQLAGNVGLELPDTSDKNFTPRESQQPLYDILEAAARFYELQLRQSAQKDRAVSYFKKRGLSGQIAKTYRLGYAPPGWNNLLEFLGKTTADQERLLATGLTVRNEDSKNIYDAMRDRVIFPIRDARGRVIGFGGRVLNDDKPKYLNSPESPVFHKGQELYGLYEAKQATRKLDKLLVVEGYTDVIGLAQFGITYAVATLGTATSTTHIERMFRLVPEIIFCFDGDDAGRRAAWRALNSALPALQDGKQASFLFLPTGEDPDSIIRKEGPELFEARLKTQAEPLTDFFFRALSEDLNLDSLEGRSRLANEAKPLLALLPDNLFRELLIDRLAKLTGLEHQTLKSALLNEKKPEPDPDTAYYEAMADLNASDDDQFDHFASFGDALPPTQRANPVQRKPLQRSQRYVQPHTTLSLTDRAVRLLLQNPSEASSVSPDILAALTPEQSELLLELLTLLHENPGLSTPSILGAWHGTPIGERLAELAASEFLIPNEGVGSEWQGILQQLRRIALNRELAALTSRLETEPSRDIWNRIQAIKKQLS